MRNYSAGGLDPATGGRLPPGEYIFKIEEAIEGTAKTDGSYKVTVHCRVVDGPWSGSLLRYHSVTFKDRNADGTWPKGAGMAIHFLHCIGEPCDCDNCKSKGKATERMVIRPEKWIDKAFKAKTETNNRGYPQITEVIAISGAIKEEDVPF